MGRHVVRPLVIVAVRGIAVRREAKGVHFLGVAENVVHLGHLRVADAEVAGPLAFLLQLPSPALGVHLGAELLAFLPDGGDSGLGIEARLPTRDRRLRELLGDEFLHAGARVRIVPEGATEPGLRVEFLILSQVIIFLLGWPLEWVPIVLIVVPFLLPLVSKLGFDLTWFGILVAVNLQTAWLSPPVALSAYFLKGVAPQWQLSDIYKGMMQFMVLQIIGLGLVMLFPQIALWLPQTLYGK